MSLPPIVIRISSTEQSMDWKVSSPEELTFPHVLEVIARVCPNTSIQAFEYEDEDGDRITVRSDEEMAPMISNHLSVISECINGGVVPPLTVYPRAGKPADKRNIHGLKLDFKSEDEENVMEVPSSGQGSSKQEEGNIQEILACGNMVDTDLQYLDILGSGSVGTVFKAFHKPTQRIMAVKVISLDITHDVQKQIISELEILYKCNSPVIIDFYGAFFVDNRISICTEFLDGGSLDKYGQIPEPILGRVAVCVVRGLQYLWSLKIMHRDVKPSNILLNTQGQVKLCDFGVSVQLKNSIAKTYVGTNAYMAPERIKGEDYSIKSEVWSLGISLFEMALGRFPYATPSTAEHIHVAPINLLNSIVNQVPPQLPRGSFSDEFRDFVSHCMQKQPQSRPVPESLMKLPFILKYDDQNLTMVALWVRETWQHITAQQLAQKAGSA